MHLWGTLRCPVTKLPLDIFFLFGGSICGTPCPQKLIMNSFKLKLKKLLKRDHVVINDLVFVSEFCGHFIVSLFMFFLMVFVYFLVEFYVFYFRDFHCKLGYKCYGMWQ